LAGARAGRRARDRRVDARRRATDRTTVGYPSRAWAAHSACRYGDSQGCARVGGGRPRPRSTTGACHDRPDLCLHRQTPARACLHARGRETARSRSRTRTAHATASAARSPPSPACGRSFARRRTRRQTRSCRVGFARAGRLRRSVGRFIQESGLLREIPNDWIRQGRGENCPSHAWTQLRCRTKVGGEARRAAGGSVARMAVIPMLMRFARSPQSFLIARTERCRSNIKQHSSAWEGWF